MLFFAIALAVKIAVLAAIGDHPLLQPRGDMDSAVYVDLAQHGTDQPYFVSPLYLFFLRACGVSLFTARVVQIILGALAVVLVFDTALLWFGETAATIAAILAIATGVFSFYEVTILQAALDPFLVALTLSFLAHALKSGDAVLFCATGVALSLLALNRPNTILWLPFIAIAIAWMSGWKRSVILAVAFAVPVIGVTARNAIVAHQPVFIASHGGLNFYIGNNPSADGTYHHVEGIRPTIAGQQEDAPRVEAREGSFARRAWNWIASNPGDALLLLLRKIAYTFNQTDLALNYSYSYFTHDVDSPLRFLVAGPWLLFPLGLAGAAMNLRDRRFAIWATFIPVYALSVAIFFVASRYRMPLLVPMCVAAGAMFVRPFRVWSWIAAAVIAVGVVWNFGLDDGRAHERTNMVVYLIEQQRFDDAAALIHDTESIARDPVTLHARAADAYRKTAIALVKTNEPDNALAAFQYAHRYDPNDASDLLNIAVLEAQRGDFVAARGFAREALRLRPGYPQAAGLLRTIGN